MVFCPWTDEKSREDWYRNEWVNSREFLAGKTVLVTGAASGIGHATVRHLLRDTRADIVAVDIDHEKLMGWKSDPDGWRVTPIHLDLAVKAASEMIPLNIDVLINNAGRLDPGLLYGYDMDLAEYTLQVMLHAPMRLTAHVLPHMRTTGWGAIINMGSVYGVIGGDGKGAYAIAKHGLLGLTRQITLEESCHGVRSVLVCPGHVDSPLLDGQIVDEAAAFGVDPAERERQLRAQLATDRFVTPDEIAANVLWLLGDDARSITGNAYVIDGGWTAGTRSTQRMNRQAHPSV
jgi:3-hydroxybutyrate dehydrogenase